VDDPSKIVSLVPAVAFAAVVAAAVGVGGVLGVVVAGFEDGTVSVGEGESESGADGEAVETTDAPIGPMCALVPL
jgi:hypothetical protein